MIPVDCADAQTKYNGQSVRFYILRGGLKFPVAGKLHVKLGPTRISIEVFTGFDGAGYHFEYFHLPQEAVDSIRPTGETDTPFEVTAVASHFLRSR